MATSRKYDLYSDAFRAATYETFAEMRELGIPAADRDASAAGRTHS